VISLIILVVVTALTITTLFSWHGLLSSPVVLSYWLLANGTLLFCMLAFLIGRRFNDHPVAVGRVAAIVPACDEDPEELRAAVHSILGQSMPPEMVYVVDDGSKVPVGQPFYHPRVTWLRKKNGGKRSAQVYALDRMNAADWDLILTVDGDSILDLYALEHQLRAFSGGGRPQCRRRRSRVIAGGAVPAHVVPPIATATAEMPSMTAATERNFFTREIAANEFYGDFIVGGFLFGCIVLETLVISAVMRVTRRREKGSRSHDDRRGYHSRHGGDLRVSYRGRGDNGVAFRCQVVPACVYFGPTSSFPPG
jgi:glycosyltransferase involved in cell wall biosynthesis